MAKHAPAASTPPDDDEQVPAWTTRYPAAERKALELWGVPLDFCPRAHEANVRLLEVFQAFDKGSPSLNDDRNGRWLLNNIFPSTVNAVIYESGAVPRHGLTDEERFMRIASGELPPARPLWEIEVTPNWLERYPPEHASVLQEWGVPTIAGTQVDDFNQRLIELVPPGCNDPELLQEAAGRALLHAFGHNLLNDE